MKITLEDTNSEEVEVIIRGNIASDGVQRLISLIKSTSTTTKIILFDENKEVLVQVCDILYFEIDGRKVVAAAKQGKLTSRHTLSEISALFKNQGICQINKGQLVNTKHVKSLEAEFSGNYVITLANREKLVVSRFYMKEFRKSIMEV